MLHELRIRDIAIIEDVTVSFGPGLNVLSGETGAGKSIILGALGLVLGGRGSADIVRTGRDGAEVQGIFDLTPEVREILAELDLSVPEEEELLLVRRSVSAAGRSRAWIGGNPVPVASLRQMASTLVDYASQHEHQVLLDMQHHRGILDRFGGLQEELAEVRSRVGAARELKRELDRLRGLEDEQRARADYLRYQLDELDSAEPTEGEEQSLEKDRLILGDAVRLAGKAREAEQALYGGNGAAGERLGTAVKALRDVAAIDPTLADTLQSVQEALIAVEDAGRVLGSYASRMRADPRRLGKIEDRLAQLRQLARKHRTDTDGLVALHARIRADLQEIEGLDVRLDGLEAELRRASALALTACAELSRRRREAAGRLSSLVEVELASLAMPHARLVVDVAPLPPADGVDLGAGVSASEHGADAVELLLSANLGEEPRSLVRVASGGELSRILLSVRRALSGTSSVQVQVAVFDEIDSGMGGATAESVTAKLVDIAAEGQVLAITHLPRIAGAADHHFRVEKIVESGRTRTDVHLLRGQERVEELVRMVAGTANTQAAETFARELLDWRAGESPP